MKKITEKPVFRFAPSPNGELHLGHAFSALTIQRFARKFNGSFLLRIEDIDTARCTPAFEQQMLEDLEWLGIEWDSTPRRQSEHFDEYRSVLDQLAGIDLIYPSKMSRGEIKKRTANRDWPTDPDGSPIYPGTERNLSKIEKKSILCGDEPYSLRLDMQKAIDHCSPGIEWIEFSENSEKSEVGNPAIWGDVILARKETPASYHLCCVVDDAIQGVTHIVRGVDLFQSTSVHRTLQMILGLQAPKYHHHVLILGDDKKKLSKSDGATSIRSLRKKGLSPEDVKGLLPAPAET